MPASGVGTTAALAARLFRPATRQKLLAFASLIALMVFFSLASENFLQVDNMVSILQATAVNGVLGVASTFVIISGGIDLSVGTLMTFCAVMAGVVLTYMGMPLTRRRAHRDRRRRAQRLHLGGADREAEDPAVHRDAGHDDGAQGLVARDLGDEADLLQRHPGLHRDLAGLADRRPPPFIADPQRRADPVRRCDRRGHRPEPDPPRAATRSRSAATRKRCACPA